MGKDTPERPKAPIPRLCAIDWCLAIGHPDSPFCPVHRVSPGYIPAGQKMDTQKRRAAKEATAKYGS